MKNILLKIEYDGTNYGGWQIQDNSPSVQQELQNVLSDVFNQSITLIGCSRTDSGVHATSYCANFTVDTTIPAEKISYAVNHLLPYDIKITSSSQVSDDFHARYNAISKTYKYYFYSSPFSSPLLNNRAWQVKKRLELEPMKTAAKHFTGTHEFDAFCAVGGQAKTTKRTIFYSDVTYNEFLKCYVFEICGTGFLYNMVRIIAGTLVSCGENKLDPNSIPFIIDSKDRKKAGITAPAHGLYLYEVTY